MKFLWLVVGLLITQAGFAQCDKLLSEPKFGVANKWKSSGRYLIKEVSFESSCLKRTECYLSGDRQSRCDKSYHENLAKVCKRGYPVDKRQYGQCMQKINTAARFVKNNGSKFYREQKRKIESLSREKERKARIKKRREGFLKRAEERKMKRMGRN